MGISKPKKCFWKWLFMPRRCLPSLEEYGLAIHLGKTEYLVIQQTMTNKTIAFHGATIPCVRKFRYLGTTITHNLSDSEEVG